MGIREEMLELAIAGHDQFDISTIEIERGGVSYSVDTLRELSQQQPQSQQRIKWPCQNSSCTSVRPLNHKTNPSNTFSHPLASTFPVSPSRMRMTATASLEMDTSRL